MEINNVNLTTGAETDWKSKYNDLWFYAGDGVFRQRNSTLYYLPFDRSNSTSKTNYPFKLSRFSVYYILKDKEGNIWSGFGEYYTPIRLCLKNHSCFTILVFQYLHMLN